MQKEAAVFGFAQNYDQNAGVGTVVVRMLPRSHVALPFPMDGALYGMIPNDK